MLERFILVWKMVGGRDLLTIKPVLESSGRMSKPDHHCAFLLQVAVLVPSLFNLYSLNRHRGLLM